MEILHKYMEDVYEESKLDNPLVVEALSKMDQNLWGSGCVYLDVAKEFAGQLKAFVLFVWVADQAIQRGLNDGFGFRLHPMLFYFKEQLFEYLKEFMKEDKGKITLDFIEEELTLAACKEQKLLKGIWRDHHHESDLMNINSVFWDLKIPISRNKQNERIFNVDKTIELLKERHRSGYSSIIDITKLEDGDAEALVKALEEEFDRKSFNTIVIVHQDDQSKSKKLEKTHVIRLQEEIITTCSNLTLNTFYKHLLALIKQTEHRDNPKIMKFISDLDQSNVDIDLVNYGFDKDEASTLVNISTSAIESIESGKLISGSGIYRLELIKRYLEP